ncbi:MAG: PPC domain-containing protein, partial [Akkermansiaceae bacterium]|nr:PPC domain-containing protein [Verrucomicrobiales bacterium]
MRHILWVACYVAGLFSLTAQVFTGTNAPNTGTNFTLTITAGTTNLSLVLPGSAPTASYLFLRKNSAPTESSYDFSSQTMGQTNALYLEQPEISPGTYYVRVSTPAGSGSHTFSLTVQTNRTDLRTVDRPVTKPLGSLVSGVATAGANQYFRMELTTNAWWRASVDATNQSAPDLYVARGQLPTVSTYLRRSVNQTNDLLAFTGTESTPGVYYVGVFGAAAPGAVPYSLRLNPFTAITLDWDSGSTDSGTLVYTNNSGIADDYYFRITTANPSLGAWRTALHLLTTNDASLYLSRGTLPTPSLSDFRSERDGDDGLVLGMPSQFQPAEDWYILVRAKAGAQWTLVSGAPFVTDLGLVASDASSGSGNQLIGPEGMRFFSASAPAEMLAWRLWLNGATNTILIKKTSLPLPALNDLNQSAQMLIVPAYLTAGQYFIGIAGNPGTPVNLDSRQQTVTDLAYGSSVTSQVSGYGYTTYRLQVPPQQIAWELLLPSTNGNPNFAVRRNTVPNENNNDAYSELAGSLTDNITLVPPVLSDGTFYVTVYCTNAVHQYTFNNSPATVTDIDYVSTITNDAPTSVGWRFYRVSDINQQLGSLGWNLLLTNATPGTRIALRKNAAPSLWPYRTPTPGNANYYDVLSSTDFLQRPAHQAEVWYIGVYNSSNALGAFTLITGELPAAQLTDNVPMSRSNVLSSRWEFFRVVLTPEEVAGLNGPPVLGWDVRLVDVTGGTPRLVVCREKFPSDLNGSIAITTPNWANGVQWAASADWTRRPSSSDGTNEDGRILAMGVGRPLEAGTYYIGVLNSTGTNNISYRVLSRWIGDGRAISITNLNWAGGSVTNTVGLREAVYHRVVVPTNTPSWKVRLRSLTGEAMLVVVSNTLPRVDSEKRVQKLDREHYLMLPAAGATYLVPGTNYIAVIGEGVNPPSTTRAGVGPCSYVLESLGVMPEISLGLLTTNDLLMPGALEGGEAAAYHFENDPETLGFWLILENTNGNPWMVSRGGPELADPGYPGDTYGNEGGQVVGAISSSSIITVADPYLDETVMMKSRALASLYPNSSYTLRVRKIVPEPVAFDSGTYQIVNRPAAFESFFQIDVPTNAAGWDIRLTNVTSGSPQLLIARDALPISTTTVGFIPTGSTPWNSLNWPFFARWGASLDWTVRPRTAAGLLESGRLLAMGMGRPLEPGRYYIGVLAMDANPVTCTLVSRGIGAGFSIPVVDLNFAAGQVTVTNLAPRETAYFRVVIPTNATSWKVQLSATNGESLLMALKDTLPNVGASVNFNLTNSGGRKMQKLGDEQFLLLPQPGQDRIASGVYYLAVTSEGQNATNQNNIGTDSSSFTLSSLGEIPITNLGEVGGVDLVDTNSLAGGETRIYQFNVPLGVQTVEARLQNRTGNPTMALRFGSAAPHPGAASGSILADPYGNEGGENPGLDVATNLLTLANTTNGIYTLVVKARPASALSTPDATYTLRISASGTLLIPFDQGTAQVGSQAPATWRYFWVRVPTNAHGWDVRLNNVSSGLPKIVVRRETLPSSLVTTPWSSPGTLTSWPTNAQWAPTVDWTRRSLSVDGSVNEDGRIMAAGIDRPLQAGLYYIGVFNTSPNIDAAYTIISRGIGNGFAIPIVDLPFTGSVTNPFLAARDAAYYRVLVPSNAPSWKIRLAAISGECLLTGLRGALPNVDTSLPSGAGFAGGKGLQKLGNEHYLVVPVAGQTNITAGTNYLAVISEGLNPGSAGRIGPGSCSFVLQSVGNAPVTDLGYVTSEDILQPELLEGGESKLYRFSVLPGTYGVNVRLENRVNNPTVMALPGLQIPNPGAGAVGVAADSYGVEGGYVPLDGHSTIVTLPNPNLGTYTLAVKSRPVGVGFPDASYTLRLREVLVPLLNFSSSDNTNGLSHEVSGLLEDNERAFFKFQIPASNNNQPVIGWKLELTQASGLALMRARKDLLPSDANSASQMPFTNAAAIIAPSYLTNGEWFVEVRGIGSTAFTLRSSPLLLDRPAWVMPQPGETNQTPGTTLPTFADTGIGTNGLPLAGDQSLFLEQGSLHYYAVIVPQTNQGLLRAQLEAISGNPDLYLRVGAVPTLYHNLAGASGTIYDRSMLAGGTEYANWVPLDGRLEKQLKPGLWYLAVRAAGNANARYRLRLSLGTIVDLPIHGNDQTNQIIASGDWRYYRVPMPAKLPLSFNITFSQQSGDVAMYVRDNVPPGNGITGSAADLKDWSRDTKNFGPYLSYDAPGTYTFNAPPVRPDQPLYLGFRAITDSTFTLRVTTNGAPAQDPIPIAFYGGSATTNIPAHSAAIFRVDVPLDALR